MFERTYLNVYSNSAWFLDGRTSILVSIVYIPYISNELINVGFKRLLHESLMIFIATKFFIDILYCACIITYSNRIK